MGRRVHPKRHPEKTKKKIAKDRKVIPDPIENKIQKVRNANKKITDRLPIICGSSRSLSLLVISAFVILKMVLFIVYLRLLGFLVHARSGI